MHQDARAYEHGYNRGLENGANWGGGWGGGVDVEVAPPVQEVVPQSDYYYQNQYPSGQ
jgi:hypothetical protein